MATDKEFHNVAAADKALFPKVTRWVFGTTSSR